MGLFWDLLQQSQISKQRSRTESVEARLNALEQELYQSRKLLQNLIQRLEERFGEDIDEDGRIG